ncbi:MAG: Uncharacterised protein [Flavobacteriia bacterium]|nr:MAG: Uncharacterised protein [Flavobacteriia bacterium]
MVFSDLLGLEQSLPMGGQIERTQFECFFGVALQFSGRLSTAVVIPVQC